MKILACADIHMGRIPSVRTTDYLTSHSSWDEVVDKAIELSVDVLILAGDVVEQAEHWFEAYGPLISGLEKLAASHIKVIGVGGNHDYSVFPSLVKESAHIEVLGLGGKWEYLDYKGVRFVGWSFNTRRVMNNPFDTFNNELIDTDNALLGILHCDIGSSISSNYAPVSHNDFEKSVIPWWVLGHIHKKEMYERAFYCGSPYALDSNEKGEHGLYLLENEDDGSWKTPEFIPLCPYRFESCVVTLEGAQSEDDVKDALTQSLRSFAQQITGEGTLLCSITLIGSINRSLDIPSILTQEGLEAFIMQVNHWRVSVLGNYQDNTTLDVDLEKLSQSPGIVSLLAKKLLNDDELAIMVNEYKRIETQSFTSPSYYALDAPNHTKTDDEYKALVKQAGKKLLYNMLNVRKGEMR